MAEGQTFDMEEYEYKQDSALAGVMPDSWEGFARMRIHERGFNGKQADKAEKIAEKLIREKDISSAERAAEVVIKKMDERLGWL